MNGAKTVLLTGAGTGIGLATARRLLPRNLYHWLLYRSLPNVKTWGQDSDEDGST